jgi:hypothetical protein
MKKLKTFHEILMVSYHITPTDIWKQFFKVQGNDTYQKQILLCLLYTRKKKKFKICESYFTENCLWCINKSYE